ncbi:NADH-quinone oxidoreductase subunit L [Mumia sp. ZJ1417]|uniref:NADH-quinone oxidoreductase subunit 5 family protein n=1 Tax=Mumia sp. ZJ1417 TaxID=2708082 RepID=UPI00141F5837|nr:NADH-quinone oxidoreductase subunit L [Mumia sp. ZJ1417]QMW65808.1 NADH-quinone oxidoreductase subunit L [Mumia sp. ZJ1417]
MRRRDSASTVAITALLAVCAAVVAFPQLGERTGPYGVPAGAQTTLVDGGDLLGVSVTFFVDHLSAVMLLLAAGVGLLVQIYSVAYMAGDSRYRAYATIIQLFLIAMATVVTADNLWMLLVGWEVMGLCSYLLISHHWELSPARAGAVKAFLLTRIGDLGLLVAIFGIGHTFGTYEISEVLTAMASPGAPEGLTWIGLLLVLAVVGKSAQFPLHTWLADAMPGPTPISALIHAATMVAAGVFLVARLYPVLAASAVTMTVLAVIACVTMLLAALFALTSRDLKRVLAWSTVSQLAYMFAALSVGGYDAGIDHLLSHGAFKALLFLAAGSVAHAVGSTALSDLGGLRAVMPWTFVTATIGFAALAGVVPTVGFFSKDAVIEAAWHGIGHEAPVAPAVAALVLACGLVTAVVTVVYAFRTWWVTFVGGEGRTAMAEAGSRSPALHEAPPLMVGPLVVLAAVSLLLSLAMPLEPLTGLVTTVLVVAAGWLAWRTVAAGRDPADLLGAVRPAFDRELAMDVAYDRAGVAARGAGDVVVATDRDILGFYPRAAAWVTVALSKGFARAQSGNAQVYVTVLAVGVLVIAGLVVVR